MRKIKNLKDFDNLKKNFQKIWLDHIKVQRYDVTFSFLKNCKITSCDFSESKQSNSIIDLNMFCDNRNLHCSFENSKFKENYFENHDVRDSIFSNALFNKNEFKNSNLRGCDFTKSKISDCSFYDSDLKNINFSQSDIKDTTFFNCDMYMCNFSCANFESVKFENCNLFFANFENMRYNNLIINKSKINNFKELDKFL